MTSNRVKDSIIFSVSGYNFSCAGNEINLFYDFNACNRNETNYELVKMKLWNSWTILLGGKHNLEEMRKKTVAICSRSECKLELF